MRHLIVKQLDNRRHLEGDPSGHDHQIALTRRCPKKLGSKPRKVVARSAGCHHFDRATGETESHRPERVTPTPILELAQEDRRHTIFAMSLGGCLRVYSHSRAPFLTT